MLQKSEAHDFILGSLKLFLVYRQSSFFDIWFFFFFCGPQTSSEREGSLVEVRGGNP